MITVDQAIEIEAPGLCERVNGMIGQDCTVVLIVQDPAGAVSMSANIEPDALRALLTECVACIDQKKPIVQAVGAVVAGN